jgi:poly(3-hydroxybutyrate) depolymerase
MMMKRTILSVALTLGLSSAAGLSTAAPLQLDLSKTTVSGLSSGGYMATQFHLSHAEWVQGVGIIAAGPYYCAQNGLLTALGSCVNKQEPAADMPAIATYIDTQRKEGNLAATEALEGDKAWILHGTEDLRVIEPITRDLVSQYRSWLGEDDVTFVGNKAFSHHFPTLNAGNACKTSKTPFIGNCNYDAAGEMLSFIVGELKAPKPAVETNLHTLSQKDYAEGAAMGESAFVYVPTACKSGEECTVHISFHGCNQFAGAEGVTDHYARMTGINRWAESNNMVVLYPQTTSSSLMPMNPQGCWDWWGYTSEDYATKNGPQIQAVEKMAKALNGSEF